jgi:DNA-directed RNA polymerase specialized sigma subunit
MRIHQMPIFWRSQEKCSFEKVPVLFTKIPTYIPIVSNQIRVRVVAQPTVSERIERGRLGKKFKSLPKRYTAPAPLRVTPTVERTPERQQQIVDNVPAAKAAAVHKCRSEQLLDDMFQAACEGLIGAVDRHGDDEDFRGFLGSSMAHSMNRELGAAMLFKRPTGLGTNGITKHVASARTQLTRALGRAPTNREIADALGWDERDVKAALFRGDRRKAVRKAARELWATLHREPTDEEIAASLRCSVASVAECRALSQRVHTSHADEIPQWDPTPVMVESAITAAGLTKREELCVRLKFSFQEPTNNVIGNELGLSTRAARLSLKKAIEKIRKVA